MTAYQPNTDTAPVAISGQVGTTMSLYDFLKLTYGDNVDEIPSTSMSTLNAVNGAWPGTGLLRAPRPQLRTPTHATVTFGVAENIQATRR